jgi:hypothetical protein
MIASLIRRDEAPPACADQFELRALWFDDIDSAVEVEELFGDGCANLVKAVDRGEFLGQIEKGCKRLFLRTLEVVKAVAFLFFSDPEGNALPQFPGGNSAFL